MDAPSPLHFHRCGDCAALAGYPRVMCPRCGSRRLEWEQAAGGGTVYSTTAIHSREGVHNVALVDLDEGVRVMTTVVGVDPDAVPIGARVRGRVEDDRLVFEVDAGG